MSCLSIALSQFTVLEISAIRDSYLLVPCLCPLRMCGEAKLHFRVARPFLWGSSCRNLELKASVGEISAPNRDISETCELRSRQKTPACEDMRKYLLGIRVV
jgi:hypothetical protein